MFVILDSRALERAGTCAGRDHAWGWRLDSEGVM